MLRGWCVAILGIAAISGWVVPGVAKVLRVRPDGSAQTATIQSAIDRAADGDSVVLDPGVYVGQGNRAIFFKGKAITVTSRDGAASTVIDCEGAPGFILSSGEGRGSVLSGITIRNSRATLGAGVSCADTSPTIVDNVFDGCFAQHGGGAVYVLLGAPVIANNVIRNCVSSAIEVLAGAPFIENNEIQGGVAGIVLEASTGIIARNHIEGSLYEGLFLKSGSSPGVSSNVIISNGIGLAIHDSSPNVLENTLSHNEKFGIYVSGRSGPVINHTIIAFTSAGPGLVCGGETNPIVSCSNFFGNSVGDFECAEGSRNFSMDPLFCEPAAGNYALRSDSPCTASKNECGAPCGALPVACDVTAVKSTTWSKVKRIYSNR